MKKLNGKIWIGNVETGIQDWHRFDAKFETHGTSGDYETKGRIYNQRQLIFAIVNHVSPMEYSCSKIVREFRNGNIYLDVVYKLIEVE